MPEMERTNYEASGRMGYTAIDRFKGRKCQEFLTRFSSKKEAELVAGHLNRAYQLGREEMMEELAELASHEGGIFYINQMLMAANDPMCPVTVTQMISDMAEHRRRYLELNAKFPNVNAEEESELDDLRELLRIPDPFVERNSATWNALEAGAAASRSLRESDHEPSLGCCPEHFNKSPGNPVSP